MFRLRASQIALAAVMIAVTAVATLSIRIPIPATQGYFNLSDAAIYFTAFAFGPWHGLVAGGVGTALADLLGGYAQWAVLSFLAHGLQGLVAGYLGHRRGPVGLLLGWLCGSLIMIALYFLGAALVIMAAPGQPGWVPAAAEILPNVGQNIAGGIVGIPLYYAVRRAYPPIERLGRAAEWREG